MLIDVHTHFHPPRMLEELSRHAGIPRSEVADGVTYIRYGRDQRFPLRPEMTDVVAKVAEMDRTGVDRAIVSMTMPGVDGFGGEASRAASVVNEDMALVLEPHRDRVGWVATLPMDDPEHAGAELRRAVGLGARGAMIFSNVAGRPLDLATDRDVFATASELGVPLLLHPAYPLSAATLNGFELVSTLGYLFDTSTAALRLVLSGLFTQFPDLVLVICHAGSLLPYQAGRIDYQALNRPGGVGPVEGAPSDHLRRLYTDTVCDSPQTLRFALDFFGASHVMMGSDHPQWPMGRGVDVVASTVMGVDERDAVESATAARLFDWPR